MRIGDETEATRWCEERYGPDGSGFAGDVDFGPADIQVLQDEATTAALFASVIEAFRPGVAGYAQDVTVQGRPWSFDPAQITSPTKILHGTEDTFAPPAHARHTAEIIPGASLTLLEGQGHLSLIQQVPALVASLI
jgi:pimeloyl-ACP methyl ester carboxylesterase